MKDYNEYRVRFTNLPGGPDNEAIFIELENERGESMGGFDFIDNEDGTVSLCLPIYQVVEGDVDQPFTIEELAKLYDGRSE